MKEILVEAHGGPEQLKLHDSPSQAPGPNHVLVRISAAGVNFMDTGVRRGIFWADKTPPFVPGVEGAGRVMALGEGVDNIHVGDRVAWFYIPGSYAEELNKYFSVKSTAVLASRGAPALLCPGITTEGFNSLISFNVFSHFPRASLSVSAV